MNSDKLSVIFFNLFIISFPLSVTISQSFAILSFFTFLYSSYSNRNFVVTFRNRAFISAIAIYFALIPSLLWNLSEQESSLFTILTKSEISDFWMCFAVLPAFYHIRNPQYKTYIMRSLYLSAFLIVLTGSITIFTPFRLASYITDGFQVREGTRLQHFAGDFWGRYTYLPIGLMNTHLTFGGICGLLFPGLVFHLGMTYQERKPWKNILLGIFSLLFLLVLFFNQSRSIWLGIVLVLILICIKLFQASDIKILKFQWKSIYIFVGIVLVIIVTSVSIYQKNWLLQRAFQEGLADNTTENQRYFIYKNTLSILKKHWFIGIGPGRFDSTHKQESNRMIESNEQLWYEIFISPRQHAHHDLLHFYTIGGIFGLVAILHFWFYLFRLFIKSSITSQTVLFTGVFTIFIAGFFQCYLLDDEVALPLFAMIGLFAGSLQKEDARSIAIAGIRARRKINPRDTFLEESISIGFDLNYFKRQIALLGKDFPFKKIIVDAFIILIIPIGISFLYILYKTRLEPIEVYKRKITVNYNENKYLIFKALKGESVLYPTRQMKENDFIRIEGCLSHRFTNPITIRKNKYQFVLKLTKFSQNPPLGVFIQVKERDAFDQDKLYKVHRSKPIGSEYYFPLKKDDSTHIILDDEKLYDNILESNIFPDNIYFRDFEFRFAGFDSTQEFFDLPVIEFGKLCDAE